MPAIEGVDATFHFTSIRGTESRAARLMLDCFWGLCRTTNKHFAKTKHTTRLREQVIDLKLMRRRALATEQVEVFKTLSSLLKSNYCKNFVLPITVAPGSIVSNIHVFFQVSRHQRQLVHERGATQEQPGKPPDIMCLSAYTHSFPSTTKNAQEAALKGFFGSTMCFADTPHWPCAPS